MGRTKLNLTEEERKERKKQIQLKYISSEKGKTKLKEAAKKYQQSDKYKNYKKNYYRRVKEE